MKKDFKRNTSLMLAATMAVMSVTPGVVSAEETSDDTAAVVESVETEDTAVEETQEEESVETDDTVDAEEIVETDDTADDIEIEDDTLKVSIDDVEVTDIDTAEEETAEETPVVVGKDIDEDVVTMEDEDSDTEILDGETTTPTAVYNLGVATTPITIDRTKESTEVDFSAVVNTNITKPEGTDANGTITYTYPDNGSFSYKVIQTDSELTAGSYESSDAIDGIGTAYEGVEAKSGQKLQFGTLDATTGKATLGKLEVTASKPTPSDKHIYVIAEVTYSVPYTVTTGEGEEQSTETKACEGNVYVYAIPVTAGTLSLSDAQTNFIAVNLESENALGTDKEAGKYNLEEFLTTDGKSTDKPSKIVDETTKKEDGTITHSNATFGTDLDKYKGENTLANIDTKGKYTVEFYGSDGKTASTDISLVKTTKAKNSTEENPTYDHTALDTSSTPIEVGENKTLADVLGDYQLLLKDTDTDTSYFVSIKDSNGDEVFRTKITAYKNTGKLEPTFEGALVNEVKDKDGNVTSYNIPLYVNNADMNVTNPKSNAQSVKIDFGSEIADYTIGKDSDLITNFGFKENDKISGTSKTFQFGKDITKESTDRSSEFTVKSKSTDKKTGEPVSTATFVIKGIDRPTLTEVDSNEKGNYIIFAGDTMFIEPVYETDATSKIKKITKFNVYTQSLSKPFEIPVDANFPQDVSKLQWVVSTVSAVNNDTITDEDFGNVAKPKNLSKYAGICAYDSSSSAPDYDKSKMKTATYLNGAKPKKPADTWTAESQLGLAEGKGIVVANTKAQSTASGVSYIRLVDTLDTSGHTAFLEIPVYVRPTVADTIALAKKPEGYNEKKLTISVKADAITETTTAAEVSGSGANAGGDASVSLFEESTETTTAAPKVTGYKVAKSAIKSALEELKGTETALEDYNLGIYQSDWSEIDDDNDNIEFPTSYTPDNDGKIKLNVGINSYSEASYLDAEYLYGGTLSLDVGAKVSVKSTPTVSSTNKAAADKNVVYASNDSAITVTNAGNVTAVSSTLKEGSLITIAAATGGARLALIPTIKTSAPKSIVATATSLTLPTDGVQEVGLKVMPNYGIDTKVTFTTSGSVELYSDKDCKTKISGDFDLTEGIGKIYVKSTATKKEDAGTITVTPKDTTNGAKPITIKVGYSKSGAYENIKALAEKNSKKAKSLSVAVNSYLDMGISVSPVSANTKLVWNVKYEGPQASGDKNSWELLEDEENESLEWYVSDDLSLLGTDDNSSGSTSTTTDDDGHSAYFEIVGGTFKAKRPGHYYISAETVGTDSYGNTLKSGDYSVDVYTPVSGVSFESATFENSGEENSGSITNGNLVLDYYTLNANIDCGGLIDIGYSLVIPESANTDATLTKNGVSTSMLNNIEPIAWTSSDGAGLSIINENISDGYITYDSNDGNYLNLSANAVGKYTITGTTKYSKQKFTFKVNVSKAYTPQETGDDDKLVDKVLAKNNIVCYINSMPFADGEKMDGSTTYLTGGNSYPLAISLDGFTLDSGSVTVTSGDPSVISYSKGVLKTKAQTEDKEVKITVAAGSLSVSFTAVVKATDISITNGGSYTSKTTLLNSAEFDKTFKVKTNYKKFETDWYYTTTKPEADVNGFITFCNATLKTDGTITGTTAAEGYTKIIKLDEIKTASHIWIAPAVYSGTGFTRGDFQEVYVYPSTAKAVSKIYASDTALTVIPATNDKGEIDEDSTNTKTVYYMVTDKEGSVADSISTGTARDAIVSWTSSNRNIAYPVSVTDNDAVTSVLGIYDGVKIVGVAPGTATITGVTSNGGKKVSIKVTVVAEANKVDSTKVGNIKANSSLSLTKDGIAQLKYSLSDSNNKAVSVSYTPTYKYTLYKVSNVAQQPKSSSNKKEATTTTTTTAEATTETTTASTTKYTLEKDTDGRTLKYTRVTDFTADAGGNQVDIKDGTSTIISINTKTGIVKGVTATPTDKSDKDYVEYYLDITEVSSGKNVYGTTSKYIPIKVTEATKK